MNTTIISSLLSTHNGTLCMACNYDGADHFSISHGWRRKVIIVGNLLKSLHHLQIVKSDWLNIMLLKHYTTHNFIEWPTTCGSDEHCAFHPVSNEIKPKKMYGVNSANHDQPVSIVWVCTISFVSFARILWVSLAFTRFLSMFVLAVCLIFFTGIRMHSTVRL